MQRDRAVLVMDRALKDLAVEADRGGFVTRIEPDKDRRRVARLTSGHRVASQKTATEGRYQAGGLPSIHGVDLDPLTDQREQGGEASSKVMGGSEPPLSRSSSFGPSGKAWVGDRRY